MRLSQMSTDRSLDALCQIAPAISAIVEDPAVEKAVEAMLPQKAEQGEEKPSLYAAAFGMIGGIGGLAPLLLREHRREVYCILSVLHEKEPEEIAAQNILTTLEQVKEAFGDRDLLSFFRSFGGRESGE